MAAMAADIDKGRQPCFVADRHDGYLACAAGDVVARVLELVSRANVVPAPSENFFDFQRRDSRVGVPVGGKRFAAIKRCEQIIGSVDDLACSGLNHKICLFYLAVRISFFLQTVGLRACSLNHALTGFFGGPALIRRGTDSSKTALAQSKTPG